MRRGLPASARLSAFATPHRPEDRPGELDWNVDPDHQQISGTGMSKTLTSQSASGRTPNLVLDIRAGAAQVTIEEN